MLRRHLLRLQYHHSRRLHVPAAMTLTASSPNRDAASAATAGSTDSLMLSEAQVLAKFDQLVKTGIVKYDYAYKTEYRSIEGVDVSPMTMAYDRHRN